MRDVDPVLGLLILWALSSRGKRGGGGGWPSPFPGKASDFPKTPPIATPVTTPPSVRAGAKWKPYAPLNQAVIARAVALLKDPTMKVNDERIEPDPAGSGKVRYWKVAQPPGKVSVTAWRPNLAQLPAADVLRA